MPSSTRTRDEKQFWKLVWPTLKTGGWTYEEEGAEGRGGGGSDRSGSDEAGRPTAVAGGNSRRTSSRNRKRSTTSSTSGNSSISSDSSSPTAASPLSTVAAPGAAADGSTTPTPPKKPVFVPPVVGVASEALEEAMRRSAPADGSLEEERRSRLVGVNAVIELLQQVPGFPGTTTGIVNYDAVAAAARGVIVRTPSPPTVVETGVEAGAPACKPQPRGETAVGSPSSRSRSSSISSSDEAVTDPPAGMCEIWSSATGNSNTQQHVPSSVGSDLAASNGDALAASATRRGRVIKKPVRLEEQPPGRQTLPGRNGRADALAKLSARAATADQAQPGAGSAAGASSANGRVGVQQDCGKGRATAEESAMSAVVGGSERCVARLGTAAASCDSVETGARSAAQAAGSSNGKDGVDADKGSISSSAGSVDRTALPLERHASGSNSGSTPQGDAEGAGGAGSADGESSKKGKSSVRERDRLVVPDPPPERPVGGLGPAPEDAIKEYKRAFDDVVWPALAEEFGWTKVYGPRMHDVYYLPMGIVRGQNGARCRVDYYDSNRQVLIHMAEHEDKYRGLLERAWAAAILKPRAIGRKSAASGGSKRKKRWTEHPRRKSTMMKKEYPKKVSLVGTAYQVDPLNLPIAGPSEDYVPPEDVEFEQVWDPSILLPSPEGATAPPDPSVLVDDFKGFVSHDKCLEIIYRCGGDQGDARKILKALQRSWRARYPGAGLFAKEAAKAKEIVERETAALLAEATPPPSSAAAGSSGKSSKGVAAGGSCPIVEGSTTVTATTTRSAVAWGGGAAAVASRRSGSTAGSSSGGSGSGGSGSGGGGGGSTGRGGRGQGGRAKTDAQDSFWCKPLKSLVGGKCALDRQVEGGVSIIPPGTKGREKLSPDLNLSKPWSPREAERFTRALLEEGSKNFYVVQKALPDRQLCELVDRYYGGWKQTDDYNTLKQSISLSKKQSACGRCHAGGDLVCCDGCDAVYHPECVGISVVPEGDWFCPACVSVKKNEIQRTAGASTVLPRVGSGRAGAKPAVAGTNDEVPANAAKSKRARSTVAVETAATAAVAASSKKPRTVVGDKGGGAGSGKKAEQAPARGGPGRQPRPSSQPRMERVAINLGSARSAASSVAGVSKRGSSEASSSAPSGSAVTKNSASSASHRNDKDTPAPSDQLGKRPQGAETAEQNPGKRAARGGKIAAVPPKSTVQAATPEAPARLALGGSATAVDGGAQKTAITVRSQVPEDKPGGEWGCLSCAHHNRSEDKRCRKCEGLRLVGAEVPRKAPQTIAPAPPTAVGAAAAVAAAAAAAAAVPVAAPASLVGTSNVAGKPQPRPARRFEIEPVFSRPASAVANAAAAAALAAAAAGARANTSPRGKIEPIFSRPASAVANAAAAAAAAAASAASARAARAPAPAAPAPSRVWCCRACSTFNRRSTIYCVSCRTRKEFKDVEEGKPDWWCCRKCSRFNNRSQDGNTCRVCSTVHKDDPVEQEEGEMISVGEDISMPGMAATAAERFVQL